jgi:hypothetical protein
VALSAPTAVTATFNTNAPPVGQEIVLDNAGPGVQDAVGGRTFTGKWCLASASDSFGGSSLYSCGRRRDTYRWTPRIPASAAYDVYVWIATSSRYSTNVPIVVRYAGGSAGRLFNERTDGGRWILHGRYSFAAGTAGYVEVSDVNGTAAADAVRFVPVSSTMPSPGQPPGLVAAYTFNETGGAGVVDVSGNGNTGTMGAGVSRTSQGRFGGALAFDGTGFVTIPHSAGLDLTTGMTIEAWVYPTGPLTDWATTVMKEMPGDSPYLLYAGTPQDAPVMYITPRGIASARAIGVSALPVNTWSHLAGTFDGSTLRLYVNGTQVASRAVTGVLSSSTGVLTIGGNAVWGEYFAGRIDEVRIYNRALSPAEIQGDMNAGF